MDTMETSLSFSDEIPAFVRLGKMAAYSALTPQQQIQYDDSFNNYLAYMGAQEYKINEGIRIGEERGIAKGRAEGRAEGEQSKAIAMARIMKADGESIDKIIRYTGLTAEQIQSL